MADKLFVCKGATCKCTLQTVPGILDVTSQSIKKLEGKLQATAADKTFATPFGGCKRSSKRPPCTPVLGSWSTTAKNTRIQGNLALLEISTNTCSFGGQIEITNANQTIGKTADIPTNEIVNPFKGEVHFRRKLEPGGAYSLFGKSFTDILENQVYGFDWIRDTLDGQENYLSDTAHLYVPYLFMDHVTTETSSAIPGTFQNSISVRSGQFYHYVDYDASTRKLNSENLYWLTEFMDVYTATYVGSKTNEEFYDEILNIDSNPSMTIINQYTDFSGDIIEYNRNRSVINRYRGDTQAYKSIYNKLKTEYYSFNTSILITSFEEMVKEFTPTKTYVDTPLGTEMIGNNSGKITLNINGKNYYTPWLAALKSNATKLYALSFLDQTITAGEIHFKSSNSAIKITPEKIAASGLSVYPYPIVNQTSDGVPASNKQELEITFTNGITNDEIIEARFFDDEKKDDPNYKGDVIGLLNVLKNEIEYDLTYRFVNVCFTDMNKWLPVREGSNDNRLPTGEGLVSRLLSFKIEDGAGPHLKENQLGRAQAIMDLFNPSIGSQQDYLKSIFKQALIHYNSPIFLPAAIEIDISELYDTKSELIDSGLSFSPRDKTGRRSSGIPLDTDIKYGSDFSKRDFIIKLMAIVKSKVNAVYGNHEGVTVGIVPYNIDQFGVSDGIGGQNVLISLKMQEFINKDRATAAHEGMHSMGLEHSFANNGGDYNIYITSKDIAETIFVQEKTENVMDYSPVGRSTFKYQWKKLQSDLPDVKPKR